MKKFIVILVVSVAFGWLLHVSAATSEAVEVCSAWEHIVRQIADARDTKQTMEQTIGVLDRHVAEGRIPAGAYPMVIKMIVLVYGNPQMSADELAKKVKGDCYAAFGVKDA